VAAGLAVAHPHLRHHCHDHHVVLTLLHQKIHCGVIIKGRVAARRYNNEDFRRAVEDALRRITPKMLRRMSHRSWRLIRLCVLHQDAHTDSLDM
jgi:hypothetical protein